ncbi:glycoside hydrolase family 3 N-terminal domain-containing protein [Spirochaeta lutea]|uniref:glycoside hydrolase family 3 N-terminal domain-containing protein n=1 Tax=Spirochaeta lutea TaxID=1480694 RepID=UPI00068BE6EF|nr:glycoside hydrolase family 3 protein [Spirochaeta lutea]
MKKRGLLLTGILLTVLLIGGLIGALVASDTGTSTQPAVDLMASLPTTPLSPQGLEIPRDLPALSQQDLPKSGLFWQDKPDQQIIDELMEAMSPEQILGQVFLLGWPSERPDERIISWVRERNLGGVKIFGWNGNRLDRLAGTLAELQANAMDDGLGIPLFTATDQEGGWVRHVKDATSITPGNMSLGASGLPIDSFLSGYYIGLEMRALGINMNFAPTVDVYVNPEAHVIGPRAFSSDPNLTAALGLAFFKGMEMTRVIATAKHFPGHGNATGDSHGEMPVILDPIETLWNRDLLPYRVLINEGLPAVLSGHLSFPTITGNRKPASLNPYFKSTVLRQELHFEGLAITDDLFMEGAWVYGAEEQWGIETIALEALKAGNDIIMLSKTPELSAPVWNTIYDEYTTNPEFRRNIRQAVRRILKIKLRYLKDPQAVPLFPNPSEVYNVIPAKQGPQFFADQAGRGTHIIRSENIPLHGTFNSETVLLAGQDWDFLTIGRQYFPNAEIYHFNYEPFYWADAGVISDLTDRIEHVDRIIFNLANPNSLEVLKNLESVPGIASKLTVFSILTPVYLNQTPWVRSALAVYGWGKESFHAGYSLLLGKTSLDGNNPIPALLSDE